MARGLIIRFSRSSHFSLFPLLWLFAWLLSGWPACLAAAGEPTTSVSAGTRQPTTTQATTRPAGTLSLAEEERVRALVAKLGDADADARLAALDALRDLGQSAVPYVIDGLRDRSEEVRAGCAKALGVLGGDQAVRDAAVRDAALEALANALGDGGALVRIQAARAVGELGELAVRRPDTIAELAKALRDPETAVRANAALSLGQIARLVRERRAPPAVVAAGRQVLVRAALDPLVEALHDREATVRGNAAMSLGALHDPRALDPLLLASTDQEPLCRASVCQGLGDLGDRAAGGALVALLKDDDVTVRRSAIEALERLTGQTLDFKPRGTEAERRTAVERWETWWARTKRELKKSG